MPIAIEFFVGHAYAILFLWVLVEQLGLPVPSIPLLLTAGTLSATHRVHFVTALLSVVAACLISDSTWYMLGRRSVCSASSLSKPPPVSPRPRATSRAAVQKPSS
jgi:membrane protein DedA with SNARE-associated domain